MKKGRRKERNFVVDQRWKNKCTRQASLGRAERRTRPPLAGRDTHSLAFEEKGLEETRVVFEMSGGYSHLRGYDYDRERSRTVQPSRESMYRPPPDRLSQDHHYSHSHYPSSRQPAPYPHGPPSPARSSEDGSFTNGLRNLHIDSRYTMPSPPVSTGTGRPKRNENSSSGTSSWRGQLIEFYDNALPVMGSQLETLYHAIAKYIMAASDSESSDDEREKCCLNCKQNQTDFSMGAGICARRMSWFYKKHKVSVTLSGRAKASAEKQEDFLKCISQNSAQFPRFSLLTNSFSHLYCKPQKDLHVLYRVANTSCLYSVGIEQATNDSGAALEWLGAVHVPYFAGIPRPRV